MKSPTTLLVFAGFLVINVTCLKLHVVTWNVADNKRMSHQLSPEHFHVLLNSNHGPADVYAISLQENCFNCDNHAVETISTMIIDQLKKLFDLDYKLAGLELTRDSSTCQLRTCTLSGLHGTSVIMALVRDDDSVNSTVPVKVNGCMRPGLFGMTNSEKGLAGLKLTMRDGEELCFAGGHLDSTSPHYRQECFDRFFEEADDWSSCTRIYIMGDFNVRTAENSPEPDGKQGRLLPDSDTLKELIEVDEMSGSRPFGGKALIDKISETTGRKFKEPLKPITQVVDFYPTFSLLQNSYCSHLEKDAPFCYRVGRSPAWTDRIVCSSCGQVDSYITVNSLAAFSDHLPVVARFTIEK